MQQCIKDTRRRIGWHGCVTGWSTYRGAAELQR
jgi:hypothetical protein